MRKSPPLGYARIGQVDDGVAYFSVIVRNFIICWVREDFIDSVSAWASMLSLAFLCGGAGGAALALLGSCGGHRS